MTEFVTKRIRTAEMVGGEKNEVLSLKAELTWLDESSAQCQGAAPSCLLPSFVPVWRAVHLAPRWSVRGSAPREGRPWAAAGWPNSWHRHCLPPHPVKLGAGGTCPAQKSKYVNILV